MVSVFIWKFQGKGVAWGHASLNMDGGAPPGEVYIGYGLRVPAGSARRSATVYLDVTAKIERPFILIGRS